MRKLLSLFVVISLTGLAGAQDINLEKLTTVKKFTWSGSLGASTTLYRTNALENRSNPLTYNLQGNFRGNLLDIVELPFSFSINRFQSSFTKPMLQLGVSPRYKWATLHVGHRNLTFNPYTLNGHTFLGAGIELQPKNIRIGAMYGRLRPAVEIDTATNAVVQPMFRRTGYGIKLGYGSQKSFIDLIYFRAKDDSNSIANWKQIAIQQKQGDANVLRPAENTALGLSAKLTMLKNLTLYADGGVSLFTSDLTDTLGLDENFEIPGGITVNGNTAASWAGKAGIAYSLPNFVLKLEYEAVRPGYNTMGSYFFNNDLQNIYISPSGTLAKGKVVFNTSLGLQQNNLDKNKVSTSKRAIANANISVNPSPSWGFDINYNNFGTQTLSGAQPLNDTLRIRQINQTFVFTPRYAIVKDKLSHHISAAISYNDVNDRNILTKQYGNMKAGVINFNYNTAFTKRGNALQTGINIHQITTMAFQNKQAGVTVGYTHPMCKQALQMTASINYNMSYVDNVRDGNIVNGSANLSYTTGRHSFFANYNVINTQSSLFNGYTEHIGVLGYTIRIK